MKILLVLFLVVSHANSHPYDDGDRAYRLREDKQKAYQALYWYRKYFKKDPQNIETAWRLSMVCHFVGMRLVQDETQKTALFIEGRDAGRIGVALSPQCSACHFWTAINMALLGETVGPMKMLFSLREVREHLLASAKLDPAYAYGGAYRVLGLIDQKLPALLGGSKEGARKYFKLAIESSVSEPLNYLFLGRLLKDEFHETQEAINVVEKGRQFPEPPAERVESKEAHSELKELYESLVKSKS